MRTIRLYGHLGKKFGRIHKFDVKTPAEAIRALKANYPGFEQYVIEHNLPGYKITTGGENRSEPEMLQYPANKDIKIIPVIQGSGGNWGMVIIGVVMIAAAIALPYATPFLAQAAGASAAAGTAAGASAGAAAAAAASTVATVAGMASTALMAVGTALTLGGVSSLLFSPSTPGVVQNNSADQISSTHFNGAINLAQQGNPVPIAYGRVRVGSHVVSAGITTTKA